MVNIKLDSEWNLESDSKQWILSCNGRNVSFFTKLSSAIESYFELKIRGSQAKTLSGLVEYHKQCLCRLQQALEPFENCLQTKVGLNPKGDVPNSSKLNKGDSNESN